MMNGIVAGENVGAPGNSEEPLMNRLRSMMSMPLLALLFAATCTSFRPVAGGPLAPEQKINVTFFGSPVPLVAACETVNSSGGAACGADIVLAPAVRGVTGKLRAMHGDSLLVLVESLRDSSGDESALLPPRLSWVSRRYAQVEAKHFSAGKTAWLIVAIVGALAIIGAAVGSGSAPNPPPSPKPPPSGKVF